MRRDAMKLRITLTKDFDNEANMRASRDAVEAKATDAGYIFQYTIEG